MAQYQENQQTIGRAGNTKVYVAKGAISFEVSGKLQREFPSRDSVMQMKSFFEKTQSDNNSAETLLECVPETHKSLQGTGISQSSLGTRTNFSVSKTESKDSLSNSETKSTVNINMSKYSSEININAGQATKPIRAAGSMLLQPASNVRGPMVKAEYLKLNRFTDITVYSGSKKRGMVSVDELDRKTDEHSAIAFVVLADNGFNDPDELICFDSDYVVEFEGAGLTSGRSTLKASKSQERKKRVTFNCHLESVFEYPAEPKTPDSLSTQRPRDSEVSEGCSIDAANALPDNMISGKTLQPYPVCNGSGCLGFYQPRLLDQQCSVIQFYAADSFSDCSTIQRPERSNSMPMEKFKGTAVAVSWCSAEESSWSGGNTGTELLF